MPIGVTCLTFTGDEEKARSVPIAILGSVTAMGKDSSGSIETYSSFLHPEVQKKDDVTWAKRKKQSQNPS